MSKTLEEQIEEVIQSCWYYTPMSNNDTQFHSDKCLDDCVKVAKIYALEQQIELLKSLEITGKDQIYGDIDLALFRIEEQLKSLKDGTE